MVTKEPIPNYRVNKVDRAVDIIGLGGLVALVGGVLIGCSISIGPIETIKSINYGFNCASLNYSGNLPKK